MIEIVGTALNQWDTGRVVHITGVEAKYAHFANKGDSKAVIMDLVGTEAKIPDYLLQTGKQLCIYAVKDGVTVESNTFPVRKRERPENYVYEEDQRNYIYELISKAENIKDGVSATHSWNGTTLTITSASGTSSANLKGDKGEKGEKGDTPVKGVDYWTEADKESIIREVITAIGTPVFGTVDSDNNIILSGNLADGTYTLKYEDADGAVTEIGTIEVGGATYTNLADPTSEEWAYDSRLNSSAMVSYAAGCQTTNSFFCVKGDVIRIKGLDIRYTDSGQTTHARAWFYNATDDPVVGAYPVSDSMIVFDGTDTFTITLNGLTNIASGSEEDVVRGRLSGMLFAGYTAEDIIITVNEEITD